MPPTPTNRSREPLPPFRPQLATAVERAPSGGEWLHEIKYDGYRIGCTVDHGRVRLESRRGQDWTDHYSAVASAAAALPVRTALLDGEVAILLPDGRTSFQALQRAASQRQGALVYLVFDLLHVDGRNLAEQPLEQRKQELQALLQRVKAPSPLRYSEHFLADGPSVLAQACKLGLEGVVSKRRDLPYRPGRSTGWLKSKCRLRQEFVVGGFTDPEGTRQGLGALLIGYYDDEGRLCFAGKVGNGPGFTAAYTTRLRREFEQLTQRACPFQPPPPGPLARQAHWVRPERVAEVSFAEWTSGGAARQPLLEGFRDDKLASEVRREAGQVAPVEPSVREERPARRAPHAAAQPTPKPGRRTADKTTVAGVAITTPERPVYPALGFTKLDLARYYERIGPWILPYVAARPLTLVRCEHGVTRADALRSECKFLRHAPGWHRWAGPHLQRHAIQEQTKVGEYLSVDSVEGLIELAQGDILELHCWNATAPQLERPDRLVFDLDPGDDVPGRELIRAAALVRAALEELGLASWPKLTGGEGLHVVVPFKPELGWDRVYELAQLFAASLVRAHPEVFTTAFGKSKRTGRVLLDYKRNHRTAVAVAAYSPRAHPRGAVSVPVRWDELKPTLRSDQFTVKNVLKRLDRLGEDPWRDFWACAQRLSRATPKARS